MRLAAFVFMPEHLHLLVFPIKANPDIGRYLARIKQPFSKEIKQVLISEGSPLVEKLIVRERPGKTCFRFWQEGPGFDRNLNMPHAITASIDYLHQNPERRGIVQRAVEWKWSSARWYLLDPPRQQDPDLPFIHGLPVGALDG
jgi:putative transposase